MEYIRAYFILFLILGKLKLILLLSYFTHLVHQWVPCDVA